MKFIVIRDQDTDLDGRWYAWDTKHRPLPPNIEIPITVTFYPTDEWEAGVTGVRAQVYRRGSVVIGHGTTTVSLEASVRRPPKESL